MSSQVDFDDNAGSKDSIHASFYSLQRSNSVAQNDANNMFHMEKLTTDLSVPGVEPSACAPIEPTVEKPTAVYHQMFFASFELVKLVVVYFFLFLC